MKYVDIAIRKVSNIDLNDFIFFIKAFSARCSILCLYTKKLRKERRIENKKENVQPPLFHGEKQQKNSCKL